jgi:hypothetical protein
MRNILLDRGAICIKTPLGEVTVSLQKFFQEGKPTMFVSVNPGGRKPQTNPPTYFLLDGRPPSREDHLPVLQLGGGKSITVRHRDSISYRDMEAWPELKPLFEAAIAEGKKKGDEVNV